MFKKGDLILGIFLILLVMVSFRPGRIWPSERATLKRAVIIQEGQVIRTIVLNRAHSEEIKLTGRYMLNIVVTRGKIRFQKANCPDQICVKTGWLSKVGDLAACVPAKVMIKIEGQPGKTDAVTY